MSKYIKNRSVKNALNKKYMFISKKLLKYDFIPYFLFLLIWLIVYKYKHSKLYLYKATADLH